MIDCVAVTDKNDDDNRDRYSRNTVRYDDDNDDNDGEDDDIIDRYDESGDEDSYDEHDHNDDEDHHFDVDKLCIFIWIFCSYFFSWSEVW